MGSVQKAPAESLDQDLFDIGDVLLDELSAVQLRRTILKRGGAGTDHLTTPIATDRSRSSDEKLQDYCSKAHALGDLSALAISGGGIRSAAFALGIAQGLELRGLLAKFDYLSTVSGGGYVGAFLTLWAQRAGYEDMAEGLRKETWPLQHLRRYSSYLTPHKGLISSDTLTVVALYFRNLILNWLVLAPVVLLAVLAIKLLAVAIWSIPAIDQTVGALGIVTITAIGLALLDSLRQRPGWESEDATAFNFGLSELVPMFLGGITASWAALKVIQNPVAVPMDLAVFQLAQIGAAVWAIAWIIAFLLAKPEDEIRASTKKTIRTSDWAHVSWAVACFALSGALTGLILGLGFYSLNGIANWYVDGPHAIDLKALLFFCCGPSVLISSLFVGELIYVGLTSYTPWSEGEREWLARAAGYHGKAAAGWTIASLLVFGGSAALFALYAKFPEYKLEVSSWVLSAGGLAGAVTALLGKASTTVATLGKLNKTWSNLFATAALAVAAPLFVITLVSVMSAGTDVLTGGQPLVLSRIIKSDDAVWSHLGWLVAGILAFGLSTSRAINTNRFSLHGLYRNRLIRAFLGASNAKRRANAFTDFDENDNEALAGLWPNKREDGKLPPQLLIANIALNILATRELAWQERKAMSFTASPRAIGCGALLGKKGSFRSADKYSRGMTVGTAITISGAAASPNMGYHSSPSLSVLLTMFNVRLGAWLGNPGPAGNGTYKFEGPRFAAVPLVREALGLTSESDPYVYLSDGGHFENLGLYEMVRRRCRLIVLSDGGCDPACSFEDLGNAVRKIWIDLRIRIDFREMAISPRTIPPKKGPYCALGTIHYTDDGAATGNGMLLYIKPGYQGSEPLSVGSYAALNAAFPHEATGEQLFGESQFEAYRALGEYVVSTLDGDPGKTYPDITKFMEAVAANLKPPQPIFYD